MKFKWLMFAPLIVIWLLLFKANLDLITTTDTQRYAILARNLVEKGTYFLGGYPELIFPPAYSVLLTPLILLGMTNQQAVAILNSTAFVLIPVFTYLIGKRLRRPFIGLLFGLLVIVNGNTINLALISQMEIVWLATLLCGVWLMMSGSRASIVTAGIIFGVSAMIRPETLAYEVVFLLLALHKSLIPKKNLVILFISLLTILPYSYFLYQNTGKLLLSGKVATIEWDRYVEDSTISRDSIVYRLNEDGSIGPLPNTFSFRQVDWQKRITTNLKMIKQPLMELLVPLKLVGLAIVVGFIFDRNKKSWLYELLLVLPMLSMLLFHIEQRYLWPAMVLTVFWLVKLSSFLANKIVLQRMAGFLALISLLILTYFSYWPVRADYSNFLNEKKKIESRLGSIPNSVSTIISRKPDYAYYMNKDYRPLPYIDSRYGLAKFSETRRSGDFIILDDESLGNMPISHMNLKMLNPTPLDLTD